MSRVPNNVVGWHVAGWQVEDLRKAAGLVVVSDHILPHF